MALAAAAIWFGRLGGEAPLVPWSGAAHAVALLLAVLAGGCDHGAAPEAVWCETGTGPGEVVYPRAITYDPVRDNFYIIDRIAHVQRLDHDGHSLAGWQTPNFSLAREGATGQDVGPDGNLWIPDTHQHRVLIYSPAGKLLETFGSEGTGDGQFLLPTGIAFDHGRTYVSEYGGNDRIQVFDRQWHKLFQIGRFGNGSGEFARPESLVIDNGFVYVTDACNHRIAVFTTGGKFIRNMGSVGAALGQFRFPYGLAEDHAGHLIVCEFGNNRVQMIDKESGRGLKTWGSAGRRPGELACPWGVAVDKHDRIVAVDAGNNRLQVFEF